MSHYENAMRVYPPNLSHDPQCQQTPRRSQKLKIQLQNKEAVTIPKRINEIIDDNMSYPSKDLMVGNNNFLTEFATDSCHNMAKVK